MNKKITLCLALAAATSCKPETVTLGVKEDSNKTQAASHDTPSVPVAHQEANNDTEPIVIQSAGRPTSTHNTPSAPVARQGAATPEIKSLSITHDKEPLQRATKNRNILKALYSAEANTQAALTSTQAALMCASEEIETLANEQAALKRTVEEKEGNIQTLTNAQEELQRTSEEKDVIIRALKGGLPRALEHAAREGDVIFLKAIINAGNAVEEEVQPPWPAYAQAALELIENNEDINAQDGNGYTPLHRAAEAGNTATVWALIAKGADLEATDTWEYTPLHRAAYYGHKAVAALLIANGAQVNARDNDGKTPLGVAKESNPRWYNTKAVQALLRKHGGVE